MAAAPVSNGDDAESRNVTRNVTVQSAIRVPVSDDPIETSGSLGDLHFAEDDDLEDSTDSSSSFGTSCSGSDDETKSGINVMEVDSPFLGNSDVNDTTSVPNVRQKQVTDDWRKAVRPIMWRTQWLELQMKDLSVQIAKYDKELALISHKKQLQLEMLEADGSNSELPKLDVQSHDGNTMKRRKRKRREDIMDTSLYIKKHPILSYYNENKNSGAEDGLLINDGSSSVAVEDLKRRVPDSALLTSEENDRVLEQYSLREVLQRIDGIQSQILTLKGNLMKARSKAQVKVPQKSQKAQNQLAYCKKDGNRPQKKRDMHSLLQGEDIYETDAAVRSALPDRPSFSVQEGATQLGANRITFQQLFDADNPLILAHLGELCNESSDDVLIYNQAAQNEEYQQFEKLMQPAHKVTNTPLSKGEMILATQVVKHELVQETAQNLKQVVPGNKQGHNSKKKALPPKDQTKKSTNVSVKRKSQEGLYDSDKEETVYVTENTRRSQRVRKPKLKD